MHIQYEGELMVLAPGSYWQGWDSGASVSEDMCYADGASMARAADAMACNNKCRAGALTAEMRSTLSWRRSPASAAGLTATLQHPRLGNVMPRLGGCRLPPVHEHPWHKGDTPGGLQMLVDGALVLQELAPRFEIWHVGCPALLLPSQKCLSTHAEYSFFICHD